MTVIWMIKFAFLLTQIAAEIDSHSFEVDKYMHKIFVEKQLPGLIQTDNELVADIRQLDGDMKTLVYENYSKFLSATDTINKVTDHAHLMAGRGSLVLTTLSLLCVANR